LTLCTTYGALFLSDFRSNNSAFSGASMAKPLSDQSSREKDVANTLDSLRIENLIPSDSLKLGLQDYIERKKLPRIYWIS
jgi:hypothetical protein